MKYKVLIKKCSDPQRAGPIAQAISRWSGSPPETVYNAIRTKTVCIKREATEEDAAHLREMFSVVGAEVELVPIQEGVGVVPPVAAVSQGQKGTQPPHQSQAHDDDDDEDDEDGVPGRILTDSEYASKLGKRPDIFKIDKNRRLTVLELLSLIFALIAGLWLSTLEIVKVATDFYEKLPEERTAKFVKGDELPQTLEKKTEEEKKAEKEAEFKEDKKTLRPSKNASKGMGGTSGGGGDPRARVTRVGVLGIISGQVKGKTVASADIFGKGGFATGIDAVISGVGGLRAGGGGGVGRKGAAGIGYGVGYGSGFGGGGSGGVDDLINNLVGGGGSDIGLKKRGGELKVSAPDFLKGGTLTGGRSKASIMRVVMQNIAALRYAYNKRLREKPGLNGKITVKFAIDEFGKVIFCEAVQSTMGDAEIEQVVVDKIKRWVFEKIDKPGDVTEVIYPFVFSQ